MFTWSNFPRFQSLIVRKRNKMAADSMWKTFGVLNDTINLSELAYHNPGELLTMLCVLKNQPVTNEEEEKIHKKLLRKLNNDIFVTGGQLGRPKHKNRAIHHLVVDPSNLPVLKTVIEMGANLDIPSRKRKSVHSRPLWHAYDYGNVQAAKCLLDAATLDVISVRLPALGNATDADYMGKVKVAAAALEFMEQNPKKPLAKLLVDGNYEAIYYRLRNPKIAMPLEVFLVEHNGKTFLDLCRFFPDFHGVAEMRYRLGIEIPEEPKIDFYRFATGFRQLSRFPAEKQALLKRRELLEKRLAKLDDKAENLTFTYARLQARVRQDLPKLTNTLPM